MAAIAPERRGTRSARWHATGIITVAGLLSAVALGVASTIPTAGAANPSYDACVNADHCVRTVPTRTRNWSDLSQAERDTVVACLKSIDDRCDGGFWSLINSK